MSNVDVKSVLDAIAEGEAAKVRVPQMQDNINGLQRNLDRALGSLQDRELAIIKYKEQIDALQAKNRSLEVERDDAGFRELEAQDKLTNMLSTLHGVLGTLGIEVSKLEPKSEPVVEAPKATNNPTAQPAEVDPAPNASTVTAETPAASTLPSQGQSETDPTAKEQSELSESAHTVSATSTTDALQVIETKPFLYRSYTSKPDDMSWSEWTAKGGDAPPWAA